MYIWSGSSKEIVNFYCTALGHAGAIIAAGRGTAEHKVFVTCISFQERVSSWMECMEIRTLIKLSDLPLSD